eukprot:jgi/Mesvir1/10382/Mv10582-RA.1
MMQTWFRPSDDFLIGGVVNGMGAYNPWFRPSDLDMMKSGEVDAAYPEAVRPSLSREDEDEMRAFVVDQLAGELEDEIAERKRLQTSIESLLSQVRDGKNAENANATELASLRQSLGNADDRIAELTEARKTDAEKARAEWEHQTALAIKAQEEARASEVAALTGDHERAMSALQEKIAANAARLAGLEGDAEAKNRREEQLKSQIEQEKESYAKSLSDIEAKHSKALQLSNNNLAQQKLLAIVQRTIMGKRLAQVQDGRKQTTALVETIARLNGEKNALDEQVRGLTEKGSKASSELTAERDRVNGELAAKETELGRLREEAAATSASLTQSQSKNAALVGELERLRLEKGEEVDGLKARIREGEAREEGIKDTLKAVSRQKKDAEKKHGEDVAKLNSEFERILELKEGTMAAMREGMARLSTDKTAVEDAEANHVRAIRQLEVDHGQKLERMKKRYKSHQDSKDAKIAELKSNLSAASSEREELKKAHLSATGELKSTIQSLTSAKEDLARKYEDATVDNARRLDVQRFVSSIMRAEVAKEYEERIRDGEALLLEATGARDRAIANLNDANQRFRRAASEMSKQAMIDAQNRAGEEEARAKEIAQLTNTLRDHVSNVKSLSQQNEELRNELSTSQNMHREALGERDAAYEELEDAKERVGRTRQEADQEAAAEWGRKVDALDQRLRGEEARVQKMQRAIEANEAALQAKEEESRRAAEAIRKLREDDQRAYGELVARKQGELDSALATINRLQGELDNASQKAEVEKSSLDEMRQHAAEELSNKERAISELEERLRDAPDKEEVEKTIAELQAELGVAKKTSDETLAKMEESARSAEKTKIEFEGRLAEAAAKLEEKEAELANAKAATQTLRANEGRVKEEWGAKLATSEGLVRRLELEISEVRRVKDEHIRRLEGASSTYEKEKRAIEEKSDEKIAQLRESLKAAKAEIDAAKGEVGAMKGELEAATRALTTAREERELAEERIAEDGVRINELLEDKRIQHEQAIGAYESQIASLKEKIATAESTGAENTELKTEIARLQGMMQTEKRARSDIDARLETLKTSSVRALKQIDAVHEKFESRQGELEHFGNALETAQNLIASDIDKREAAYNRALEELDVALKSHLDAKDEEITLLRSKAESTRIEKERAEQNALELSAKVLEAKKELGDATAQNAESSRRLTSQTQELSAMTAKHAALEMEHASMVQEANNFFNSVIPKEHADHINAIVTGLHNELGRHIETAPLEERGRVEQEGRSSIRAETYKRMSEYVNANAALVARQGAELEKINKEREGLLANAAQYTRAIAELRQRHVAGTWTAAAKESQIRAKSEQLSQITARLEGQTRELEKAKARSDAIERVTNTIRNTLHAFADNSPTSDAPLESLPELLNGVMASYEKRLNDIESERREHSDRNARITSRIHDLQKDLFITQQKYEKMLGEKENKTINDSSKRRRIGDVRDDIRYVRKALEDIDQKVDLADDIRTRRYIQTWRNNEEQMSETLKELRPLLTDPAQKNLVNRLQKKLKNYTDITNKVVDSQQTDARRVEQNSASDLRQMHDMRVDADTVLLADADKRTTQIGNLS